MNFAERFYNDFKKNRKNTTHYPGSCRGRLPLTFNACGRFHSTPLTVAQKDNTSSEGDFGGGDPLTEVPPGVEPPEGQEISTLGMPKTCLLPSEIKDVRVTQVTRTTARVHWTSSVAATFQIKFGETPNYGKVATEWILENNQEYVGFVSGLKNNTIHYYCPQFASGAGSAASPTQFAFQTPKGSMAAPVTPREFPIENPSLSGTQLLVNQDCSNFQELINQAAQLDPTKNHEIRIPQNTVCSGRYVLPKRNPGEGWVTIRPNLSDAELPPRNRRITAADQGKMPMIRTNYIAAYFYDTPPTNPAQGDFWWRANVKTWELYRATKAAADGEPPVWTPISVKAQGTTVPTTCGEGDWFFKTDEPDRHKSAWWCDRNGVYQNVYFDNGGTFEEFAALRFEENAHHYRFLNVQVSHYAIPLSYAPDFNSFNARKKGNTTLCLVTTPESSHHITFDQTWFRGQGYPASVWYSFCNWDGAYQVIANSYFSEINRWVHPTSYEDDSRAINISTGPGPGLIQNNRFENVMGITIFVNDDKGPGVSVPSDYVLRGNSFFIDDAYNGNSPLSNGRYYYRRHHFELKRGRRWLVESNDFNGGFSGKNQGASIAFTPRTGYGYLANNRITVSDIMVRKNVIRNSPQGFLIAGHTDLGNSQTLTSQRISIENNLALNLGGPQKAGWGGNIGPSGHFVNAGLGMEDFNVSNNTIILSDGNAPGDFPNYVAFAWVPRIAVLISQKIFLPQNGRRFPVEFGTVAGAKAFELSICSGKKGIMFRAT